MRALEICARLARRDVLGRVEDRGIAADDLGQIVTRPCGSSM
jgi:hypothetical protein